MYKILVVDDDPGFLKTVTEFLKKSGYEVESVKDGHEAMRAVIEYKPDLMVLDVVMPGLTGYEVSHYIKFNPNFDETLPIILLTGSERVIDEKMSVILGIDYMNKSASLQELVDRIEKILAKKEEDIKVIQSELKDLHFKGFFEHDHVVSEGIKRILEFRVQATMKRINDENKHLQ